jgi:uncharacterized protein
MPRVVRFEIVADQTERAVKFYRDVFGWEISRMGSMDYWLATTGPDTERGIDGGIVSRTDPSWATFITIEVPSVDDYAAKVVASGGQLLSPKRAVPGVGYFAYCRDSEGNAFGILEADPQAH